MSSLQEAQTRFVELMAELFQLDEAQALDFGIYRIIRHRNRAVREFLGEIETRGDNKKLVGGELQTILDDTFAAKDEEQVAQAEARMRELERDLGLSRHMTEAQREEALDDAYKRPKLRADVDEYRTLIERRDNAKHGDDDRLGAARYRLHQIEDGLTVGDIFIKTEFGGGAHGAQVGAGAKGAPRAAQEIGRAHV